MKWLNLIIVVPYLLFALSNDTLVLNATSPQGSYGYLYQVNVFSRVCDSLGVIPVFRHYPNQRSIEYLKTGKVSIEMARVEQFGEAVDSVVRIPFCYVKTRFVAYSGDSALELEGWESLVDKGYKVDYFRGAALPELKLKELLPPEDIGAMNTVNAGMNRLIIGRTDLFIVVEPHAKGWMLAHPDKEKQVFPAGVMQEVDVYAYLSVKRGYLQNDIASILRNLDDQGVLDSLWDGAIQSWTQKNLSEQKTEDTTNILMNNWFNDN